MKTFTKNKFNVDLWLDIGYGKFYSPEITFSSPTISFSSPNFYDISPESGSSGAIDIGTALRYKIIKRLFVALHLDLYYSGFKYQVNYTVNPPINNLIGGHLYDYTTPPANIDDRMTLFNLTGGLAYQLGK